MRLIRLGSLVWLTAVVNLVGCGGSSPPGQPQARDQAANHACNYYMRCGQIGAGLKYASTDDCQTQLRAYFNGAWPQDTCTAISQTGFDNCLTAIDIAACDSLADFLNVTLNKCTMANVCAAAKG